MERSLATACASLLLATAVSAATTGRLSDASTYQDHGIATFSDGTPTWCDDVLGCLNITSDWYSDFRPINRLPESREQINTRFYLHTRDEKAEEQDVRLVAGDPSGLQQTTFAPSRPTKLVIHGFTDSGSNDWVKELSQELLAFGDYNVIRVDWGDGAGLMYSQAVANTRVVGLEIGYLINWLADEYGLQRGMVHLIGHSLGAHISGYAGEQIEGLGRISGMDPAGPEYTGTLPKVRLDETDALFVDNIHTDSEPIYKLGAGTSQPMGHLDFYPNGGYNQPGCEILSSGTSFLSCSHSRAVELYTDSIRSSCNFLSYECSSYEEFQLGNCASCGDDNSHCASMGFHADQYAAKNTRANVLLFDSTAEEAPFCLYQYGVAVLAAKPDEAEDWVVGKLFGTFYGDNGEVIERVMITEKHQEFYHGEVTRFVFSHRSHVGKVVRASLEWHYDDEKLHPGTYCVWPVCNRHLYVAGLRVAPLNAYPESARLELTADLCSSDGAVTELKDGETASFAAYDFCPQP